MVQAERREQLERTLEALNEHKGQLILGYLGIPEGQEADLLKPSAQDLLKIADEHKLNPVYFGRRVVGYLSMLLATRGAGEGYQTMMIYDQDRHPHSELIFADAVVVATRNQSVDSIAIASDALKRAADMAKFEEEGWELEPSNGTSQAYAWLAENFPRIASSATSIREHQTAVV